MRQQVAEETAQQYKEKRISSSRLANRFQEVVNRGVQKGKDIVVEGAAKFRHTGLKYFWERLNGRDGQYVEQVNDVAAVTNDYDNVVDASLSVKTAAGETVGEVALEDDATKLRRAINDDEPQKTKKTPLIFRMMKGLGRTFKKSAEVIEDKVKQYGANTKSAKSEEPADQFNAAVSVAAMSPWAMKSIEETASNDDEPLEESHPDEDYPRSMVA